MKAFPIIFQLLVVAYNILLESVDNYHHLIISMQVEKCFQIQITQYAFVLRETFVEYNILHVKIQVFFATYVMIKRYKNRYTEAMVPLAMEYIFLFQLILRSVSPER